MTNKRNEDIDKHGVTTHQRYGHIYYRPESKIEHTAPVIMREYEVEDIDRETGESKFTRMYECEPLLGCANTRHFIADTYDKIYKPAHNKKLNLKADRRHPKNKR